MKRVDVVGAVIVNEYDEILCALRSQQMTLPGLWEFPGGKIEQGEDPSGALKREIREELLCEIEVGNVVADIVHEYPNFVIRLITYYSSIKSGAPVATEHEKLLWVSREQLLSLDWAPADIPSVLKLIEIDNFEAQSAGER